MICANEGCGKEFEPRTHNQKYCTGECCRLATNRRIMAKYYAKQAMRRGSVRYCDTCETTKLSRYNDSATCNSCKLREQEESRVAVLHMLGAITW